MDYVLSAADGMPRAFTMIAWALESYPRYKPLYRAGQHIYWYRVGARLGDYMAAYNLGQCYEVGRGVPQDMKMAVFWWKKAAAHGYSKAFTNLAAAYYNGTGVRRDLKAALRLYGQAALGGDRVARRMLNKLKWG
jgi:TPR repeat protein